MSIVGVRGVVVALAVGLLSACASVQPPVLDESPLPFARQATPRPQGGGLFVPHAGSGFMADQRAHRAGDVLTVVLQEVTQASKRAKTTTSKESSVGMTPAEIAGRNFNLAAKIKGESDFEGVGSSEQQNALTGSITVIVQRVLPNGLLYIQGDRALTLNQGDEILRLSGYVRASDVDQDNRVSSQRVANARISYSGHGALADVNQAGWLNRLFQSPLFPF